jgi:hypothetical protein
MTRPWISVAAVCSILLLCLPLSGCGGSSSEDNTASALTVAELRSAPQEAVIGGKSVKLTPGLFRDFQPGDDMTEDGRPLMFAANLATSDDSPISKKVRVDRVWVIHQEAIWTSQIKERYARPANTNSIFFVAEGGPKWGPNVSADVVIRIRDAEGQSHLLYSPNCLIERSD